MSSRQCHFQPELFELDLDPPKKQIKHLGGEGILNESDIPQLNAGTRRVLSLMLDGRWYSRQDIEIAAGANGVPASEGLRRMRELRKHGYEIERRRRERTRLFDYRISRKRS